MLRFLLAHKDQAPLNVQTGIDGNKCLITESMRMLSTHWQSASITTATTTTIVSARANGSILMTDLIIILSKKVASATIIPRFTDGTNTVDLFPFDAATASFQFSHAFQGGLWGWKDADFQIVTDQATTVGVLLGYFQIAPKQTLTYGQWDISR